MEKGAEIIFENSEGKILFLLRDDKPSISYPNYWDLLGGTVEEDETAEQTIVREMEEELELELKDFQLFKDFPNLKIPQTVFYKKIDLDIDKINLHEGQKLQYFSKDEILKMDLAYFNNEIMREFFKCGLNI